MKKNQLPHLKEFHKVVNHYGSDKLVAIALGCSLQFINFVSNGKRDLPALMAMRIEFLTNGKFKAIKLLREDKRCYLKAN